MSQELVTAVHASQVLRNQVLKQQVIEGSIGGGQADEAGQGAGHGNHPQHLRAGTAAFGPEQKSQAKSLVQNAGKGVGRVDADGGQERVNLALKIA